MRTLILLLAVSVMAAAAPSSGAAAQRVQGQVVDSTTGEALPGAVVLLVHPEGSIIGSALTDSDGLFLIAVPEPGWYKLRAEIEGYRSSSFPEFELLANESVSYRLRLPSSSAQPAPRADNLGGIAREACPALRRNEVVVLGWVRHARTQRPIPDATVLVSWSHLPDALREGADVGYFEGITATDSAGFYAVCGAPVASTITIHALAGQEMSGFHRLRFVEGAVIVGDEVLATNSRVWQQDLATLDSTERTTELAGIVTDSTTGAPLADAAVELTGTLLATTTDGSGGFRLGQLPPGLIRLRVRRLGSLPLEYEVALPQSGVVEIPRGTLALARAPAELEPVVVEAVVGRSPFAEFNTRREEGVGSFSTRDEFMARGNPNRVTDVLRTMPGVSMRRGPDMNLPWIITLRRGGPRSFGNAIAGVTGSGGCPPLYFLDRHYVGTAADTDIDAAVPLNDVEAVEVHPSVASLPHDFNRIGAQCGVIAFWTRFADPRTAEVTSQRGILNSPFLHFGIALGLVLGIFFGLGHSLHF